MKIWRVLCVTKKGGEAERFISACDRAQALERARRFRGFKSVRMAHECDVPAVKAG